MIYTLIFTAFLYSSNGHNTAVHSEHDYPTYEACQAAYKIAAKQFQPQVDVQGTCLKVK